LSTLVLSFFSVASASRSFSFRVSCTYVREGKRVSGDTETYLQLVHFLLQLLGVRCRRAQFLLTGLPFLVVLVFQPLEFGFSADPLLPLELCLVPFTFLEMLPIIQLSLQISNGPLELLVASLCILSPSGFALKLELQPIQFGIQCRDRGVEGRVFFTQGVIGTLWKNKMGKMNGGRSERVGSDEPGFQPVPS
jgi:hypothetical protein